MDRGKGGIRDWSGGVPRQSVMSSCERCDAPSDNRVDPPEDDNDFWRQNLPKRIKATCVQSRPVHITPGLDQELYVLEKLGYKPDTTAPWTLPQQQGVSLTKNGEQVKTSFWPSEMDELIMLCVLQMAIHHTFP